MTGQTVEASARRDCITAGPLLRTARAALLATALALVLAPSIARADDAYTTDVYLARSDAAAAGNAKVTVPTDITLVYDRNTGFIVGPTIAGFTNEGGIDVWLARVTASMETGFNAVDRSNGNGLSNGVYLRLVRAADWRSAFTLKDAASGGTPVTGWKVAAGSGGKDLIRFDTASRMYSPGDDVVEKRKFATISWTFSTEEQVALYDELAEYSIAELQVLSEYLSKLEESDYASDAVYQHTMSKLLGGAYDFGTFVTGSVLDGSTDVEQDRHVVAQLVGICHDDLADRSGRKAGLSFLCTASLPYAYQMNSKNSSSGGWAGSKMRATLNSGEVFQSLPAELRSVVRPVSKKTNNKGTNSATANDVTKTSDAFWLPSEVEINGTTTGVYASEGTRYAWFAKSGVPSNHNLTNSGGDIVTHEGSLNTSYWWLRSPSTSGSNPFGSYNTDAFRSVSSSGSMNDGSAQSGFGVNLGFCI